MPVLGTRGDDPAAVGAVLRLIDRLGFDPVDAGTLGNSQVLEPDGSPFATTYSAAQLSAVVAQRSEDREA